MSGTGFFSPPFFSGGGAAVFQPQQPSDPPPPPPSPSSYSTASSSIVIVVIVIASAVIVTASIYLLLKLLSRRCHRSFRTHDAADDVIASGGGAVERRIDTSAEPLESLPLFTFGSVTGNLTGVDCAVCLSKFEPHDQLRLLPLCCHAFHALCIDAWLVTNQTCPLCRSTVYPTDSDIHRKILSISGANSDRNGGSFRIEIGSLSRRRAGEAAASAGNSRRSYSVGSSFEYVIDDGYEVSVDSIHRRGVSECTDKESIGIPVPEPLPESLANEVSGGRSWLRDYVDRLVSFSISSRTTSFRGSGRFFTGSSRRSETIVPVDGDLEAGSIGEEISELFRWLSGV